MIRKTQPPEKIENYLGLIHHRASHYYQNHGIEYEEAIGLSTLAFYDAYADWNPRKGKFSTHLWHRISRLFQQNSESHQLIKEDWAVVEPELGKLNGFKLHIAMTNLSEDAQHVVDLSTRYFNRLIPRSTNSKSGPSSALGKVYQMLRGVGWSNDRQGKAVTEVKLMLRSLN